MKVILKKTGNKKMSDIKIGGAERFSLVDFPGKVAAVLFLQGCPWRCPFCYNTHLQAADAPESIDEDAFMAFLEKRKGKLDAVVFSGGEPLLQPRLIEAMQKVKSLGFTVGLHTGGFNPSMFAKVLPLVDWVGFDIKAPFDESHYQKATGSQTPLNSILQSLDILISSGKPFETRTTCDPRLLSIEDIYTIAKQLKEKGIKNYHLQKYRPIPSDKESTEDMCNKFFRDKDLLAHLKETFEVFDTRE